MKRSAIFAGFAGALGLSAAVLAHHVQTPLSFLSGPNVLDTIQYHLKPGGVGVPPYLMVPEEFDHHAVVNVAPGHSFTVSNGAGVNESVVFDTSDFANPAAPEIEEVLEAISNRSTLLSGFYKNGHAFLRGEAAGSAAALTLTDGTGGPLTALGFSAGTATGSRLVPLEISIPLDDHHGANHDADLAFHPYRVFVSATAGTTVLDGQTLPIAFDDVTRIYYRAAIQGQLQGFLGTLNDTSDAKALLDLGPAAKGDLSQLPDELYLAYAVYSMDGQAVEFVSNRFVVEFVK